MTRFLEVAMWSALLFFCGVCVAFFAGCDPNTPDNTTSEQQRPPVYHDVAGTPSVYELGALSCGQSTLREQLINDLNTSPYTRTCSWMSTNIDGTKEGRCTDTSGRRYRHLYQPVGATAGRVYSWRTTSNPQDMFYALYGADNSGQVGNCSCIFSPKCSYWVSGVFK